jgi:hypothetical protein
MINNSISGTSLAFVVLMFLSSFSGCAKLISKCNNCADTAGDIAKSSNKLHNLKDLETYNHNMKTLVNLYEKYKEVNIGHGLKLVLPDITRRIDDTRGYDNLFEIQDETSHFYIQTKNHIKTENSLVEDWLTFRQKISLTRTLLRIPTLVDSLDLKVDRNGFLTKAYQYQLYNETVQGLVKLVKTENGFTFIEVETPVAKENFYEIADMLLQAAILPESVNFADDSTNQSGRRSN